VEKMPVEQTKQGADRVFVSNAELGINEEWFSIDFWQAQNAIKGTASGRGTVWFLNSPKGAFVLRRYRRGGLIAKLTQFNFLFLGFKKSRPFQELSLLEYMLSSGLPVPEPIAGHCQRRGIQYQAEIITRLIPDADELFTCLLSKEESNALDWQEIGKTIKRFHKAGVDHTDLNCHNIMIDKTGKVWLIDFDKCRQRPVATQWQDANLQRLKRSFEKEANKHPSFLFKHANWQSLLEGYHG
jgi:3-deoxy-D-manno-octulosonic acid kinase